MTTSMYVCMYVCVYHYRRRVGLHSAITYCDLGYMHKQEEDV